MEVDSSINQILLQNVCYFRYVFLHLDYMFFHVIMFYVFSVCLYSQIISSMNLYSRTC